MKLALSTILLALASRGFASVDTYMTITDSSGASLITDSVASSQVKAVKAVQISSWSYGSQVSTNVQSGSGGGGAAKVSFNSLQFTKAVDGNTPKILTQLASGKSIIATIYLFKSTGTAPNNQSFMALQFRTALFATQNIFSGNDGTPLENITIAYGATQVNYSIQSASGTLVAVAPAGWNEVSNVPETKTIATPN